MNWLWRAYLAIAPSLGPYFTAGHHDDEQGLVITYMLQRPPSAAVAPPLVNTPTIVATVDATVSAAASSR
jgi:hypothetical protein